MSAGQVFSDLLFNVIGCLEKCPTHTHPHFNDREAFLLCIVSPQCIELSLLTATFDIFFSERWTHFFTGTKVIETTHGFKNNFAKRIKPINTKKIIFPVFACSVEALNCTIMSFSLKIQRHEIFKITGLVLSRCESTDF